MRFATTALTVVLWTSRRPSRAFGVVARDMRRQLASATASLANNKLPSSCMVPLLSAATKQCSAMTVRGGASSTQLDASATTTTTEEATSKEAPVEYFRSDYKPLRFSVSNVSLDINIRPRETTIRTEMTIVRNHEYTEETPYLLLDGDETSITLKEIALDGRALTEGVHYKVLPGHLEVCLPQRGGILTTTVTTVPEDNTQLSGLYKSGNMYCTQCEAMGFRRMTYYPDRPDNMAVFDKVRIEADEAEYPILLSNGNYIQYGTPFEYGRHDVVWSDPIPKPSYLFALVAGNLYSIHDTHTFNSGKTVDLAVYCDPDDEHKLKYAMESLKRAMQWDDDRFGLEYDLNDYIIVAVESFNMGAMENKGLNIFNTACVLADQKTATDDDFERVEGVIGHEYFHNWTGNRVVCPV